MTTFDEVYNYFLAKISTNEYITLTDTELEVELQQLLRTSFAECVSFKNTSADYVLNQFNRDLTDLEMNIISYNMVVHYLSPKINNIELLKQSLSSKDFQMYSQANHLSKLIELKNDSLKQFHYWMNRYGYLKRLENPKKAKVWQ
jgi:hypothetical protein